MLKIVKLHKKQVFYWRDIGVIWLYNPPLLKVASKNQLSHLIPNFFHDKFCSLLTLDPQFWL